MKTSDILVGAVLAMVLLVLIVGLRLLYSRVTEMRARRIRMQDVATSAQMAALENVQASDNFKNLFEVPVLFYALVAVALATGHIPMWLALGAWVYVALRWIHSAIHCTYNKVAHRFATFVISFACLITLWFAFAISLWVKSAS